MTKGNETSHMLGAPLLGAELFWKWKRNKVVLDVLARHGLAFNQGVLRLRDKSRSKRPAHAAVLIPVYERVIGYDFGALGIEPKSHLAQLQPCNRLANLALVPFFAEQQQKTAAAGPGNFATESAVLTRKGISLINQRIGDLRRDPLFCLPALVQQGAKGRQVGFQQRAPHVIGKLTDFMQRFERSAGLVPGGLFLFLKKAPGVVGNTGKKQHQVALEFAQKVAAQGDGLDHSAAIGVEVNEIQSSEGGRVFILFANWFAENIAGNMK